MGDEVKVEVEPGCFSAIAFMLLLFAIYGFMSSYEQRTEAEIAKAKALSQIATNLGQSVEMRSMPELPHHQSSHPRTIYGVYPGEMDRGLDVQELFHIWDGPK